MAKVPSPFLTGATGKFAGAAFQQSPGNGTILREVVKPTNPSTEAQVEQRAKFKLMSQVATVFKRVIAMKREGNITPRNMFVKINSSSVGFSQARNEATIPIQDIQLTKSSEAVSISAAAGEAGQEITLSSLQGNLYGGVFVLISENQDDSTLFIKKTDTVTLEEPAQSVKHTFADAGAGEIVLAYGFTQNTAGLSVKYDNYQKSEYDAVLAVLSKLAENSALTKTAGITLE